MSCLKQLEEQVNKNPLSKISEINVKIAKQNKT